MCLDCEIFEKELENPDIYEDDKKREAGLEIIREVGRERLRN